MVRVNIFGIVDTVMKETLQMDYVMEKVFLVGKMEVNTMENMNLTKPTGKGL